MKTLTLETDFETDEGAARVIDFMPLPGRALGPGPYRGVVARLVGALQLPGRLPRRGGADATIDSVLGGILSVAVGVAVSPC